jgi:tagaturonate reductase
MQIIISNTTEVGITLVESDAQAAKPVSFPGRVLFFLLERFRVFNGSSEAGMVIIPTELIVDNGTKLKEIVFKLAKLKGASADFCNGSQTKMSSVILWLIVSCRENYRRQNRKR